MESGSEPLGEHLSMVTGGRVLLDHINFSRVTSRGPAAWDLDFGTTLLSGFPAPGQRHGRSSATWKGEFAPSLPK